jgi:hypothetical protein
MATLIASMPDDVCGRLPDRKFTARKSEISQDDEGSQLNGHHGAMRWIVVYRDTLLLPPERNQNSKTRRDLSLSHTTRTSPNPSRTKTPLSRLLNYWTDTHQQTTTTLSLSSTP